MVEITLYAIERAETLSPGQRPGLLECKPVALFTLCLFAMSYTTHLSVYTFNFYSTHKLCSDNSQDFIPSYIFMLLQFHTILGDADYPISHFCNQLVYPLSLVFGIIDDFITCRLKLEIFRR